jgi:hypothetical protein
MKMKKKAAWRKENMDHIATCESEQSQKLSALLELWEPIRKQSLKPAWSNLPFYLTAFYSIKEIIKHIKTFPDFPPRKMITMGKCLSDLSDKGWIGQEEVYVIFDTLASIISARHSLPFVRAYCKAFIRLPRHGAEVLGSSVAYKGFALDFLLHMVVMEHKELYGRKEISYTAIYKDMSNILNLCDPENKKTADSLKQRYNELTKQEIITTFILFSTVADGYKVNALANWPANPTGYLKTFLQTVTKYVMTDNPS